MPVRTLPFVTGSWYHVYNRGVEKRSIILEERNYERLYQSLMFCQVQCPSYHFSTFCRLSKEAQMYALANIHAKGKKLVTIGAFAFMPNHYHLLLKQEVENGIQNFLRNWQDGYSKYFNVLYARVGHLFQSAFQAKEISTEELLMHISRYVHLNPLTAGIVETFEELEKYPWTSFPSYIFSVDSFVETATILDLFGKDKEKYKEFVQNQAEYQQSLHAFTKYSID